MSFGVEDHQYDHLIHHRLLMVDGRPMVTLVKGPRLPGPDQGLLVSTSFPKGVASMEWSNALVYILQRQGQKVKCQFTLKESAIDEPIPDDPKEMLENELTVRQMFEGQSAVPAAAALKSGN